VKTWIERGRDTNFDVIVFINSSFIITTSLLDNNNIIIIHTFLYRHKVVTSEAFFLSMDFVSDTKETGRTIW